MNSTTHSTHPFDLVIGLDPLEQKADLHLIDTTLSGSKPVNSPHPFYEEYLGSGQRLRDVMAGG